MTAPPLAIVQARIGSTRLKNKMLLDLGGHPLIWWAWSAAVRAFGPENVIVAMPASAENDELAEYIGGAGMGATGEPGKFYTGSGGRVFRWDGPENDVLGRFYHCAHTYRWHPDTVIVRVTPDDPLKSPHRMRDVANGERHPIELGGEAFTLAMLDAAHHAHAEWVRTTEADGPVMDAKKNPKREHLTHALFDTPPPPAPPGRTWTVDTPADLEAVRKEMEA